MTRARAIPAAAVLLVMATSGCDPDAAPGDASPVVADEPTTRPGDASAAGDAEAITRAVESGPVKVTLTLAPRAPRLGDALALTLIARAEPGVEVRMPPFGEALGRFVITEFTPRRHVGADGASVHEQRYALEAPMSGRQTIPALLVEFVDRRPGEPEAERETTRELFTEPVTIDVASVIDDGASLDALRPPREALPPLPPPPVPAWQVGVPAGVGAALLVALAAVGVARLRRRARRRSAYDVAVKSLAALAARGLPAPDEADRWYVELSAIARRYIEDRYGLRAPELTTEEFIREAGRSDALSPEHARLLRGFLEQCDRVKFAAYRPEETESQEALDLARRFVEESRAREDAP